MEKIYTIPDKKQRETDLNIMLGLTVFAVATLLLCSFVFTVSEKSLLLQLVIVAAWSAVVIGGFTKPLTAPEAEKAPVNPFENMDAVKKLDVIYVLKNFDIFNSATDPRYADFVRRQLKTHAPNKASDVPALLEQLEAVKAVEAPVVQAAEVYRDQSYVFYMSAITVGTMLTATSLMLLVAGKTILLSLILGVVILAIGLFSALGSKKAKIADFYFLFGAAVVCAIIGALLMK